MRYIAPLCLFLLCPCALAQAQTTTGHVGGCVAADIDKATIDEMIALQSAAIARGSEDPKTLSAFYVNRAQCYVRKGETAPAIPDLTRAIELNSIWDLPYFQRGELYRAAGEKEKAIADYKHAQLLNPTHHETMAALKALGADTPSPGGGSSAGGILDSLGGY